jgi:hypothetical protein
MKNKERSVVLCTSRYYSQLQWGEQKEERGRKGSINRVLRAEHPLEIDSEVWWGVKKE